ncbi:hypothetical protein BTA35_0204820 [Oceanospirillum linum]|uniref:Uncharacterized protein n=2 Tax=Oceanospirillum TaxID=965 RepID=A0A1V4T0X1_9GAMM|nr:DUF1778 domain-containing protein [Oceanospirillum multiglobuliferum]OOV88801.1 hypothetical protein BTA35_0204820 [Oceanospirillum linum]OPX53859.1 hypothetical protein BTE48_17260 [Oceanospirillum multiglobuliferum]SEF99424.1 Protein of unknown function [Oleiphilus messinensis]SMP22544.1 Protein of unknown function [Oceanospirillum linum]
MVSNPISDSKAGNSDEPVPHSSEAIYLNDREWDRLMELIQAKPAEPTETLRKIMQSEHPNIAIDL